MRFKRILLIVCVLLLAAALVYQLPPVKARLGWRLDAAWTYLRLTFNPAGELPAPQTTPQPAAVSLAATSTPTQPAPTATPNLPTATPRPSPTPLPSAVSLTSPEWVRQDWNNCGPASLEMYLGYYGWEGSQFDVAAEVKPAREDRNVNIEELAYFARNYAGWLNIEYRVNGDLDLLKKLLAAGIPVMIEEGDIMFEAYWPDDDLWAGHYLLLTGYDDASQTFTAQDSFRGPDLQVDYQTTDRNWQAFNRVYVLVYLPGQEATIQAILGDAWDVEANRQGAIDTARAEIEADPEDAYAWFNLGSSLVYFERYEEAALAYDSARSLGLPQRMLRYQFGPFFAYFHANRLEDLQTIVSYATEITPNSEEAWLWQGWAYYRQGEEDKAITAFRQAYANNPTGIDAQYALDFMGASP